MRALVDAGASEFFVGYVPESWSARFGYEVSPNRRYRPGDQVTSIEVLARLARDAHALGVPLTLTLNEHAYTGDMWGAATELARQALDCGVEALIVASPSACGALRELFPSCRVHVSGDAGIVNAAGLELFARLGVARVIFGRELGLGGMARLAPVARDLGLETEAFAMGEPCVYDGARCFACHGYGAGKDLCTEHLRKDIRGRRSAPGDSPHAAGVPLPPPLRPEALAQVPARTLALGKCGLCGVAALTSLGVTHLKVPGRSSDVLGAVELLGRVLRGPEMSTAQIQRLLDAPAFCRSGSYCYYPELAGGAS